MVVEDVVIEIGKLGKWVETVGLIVIFWIVVSFVTMWYNWKRRKLLESILERLQRVEKKLDKIIKK
jgi:hypothetical protein